MRSKWIGDILAGLTGAVAGAPQAMGFALIAGISPLYGLYAAVVATIVGALVGSSTYMTIAPTNALALLVGSTLITADNDPINQLVVLTLLVGGFQLLFGVFRLGFLTRFVSNAVMTGFITGAGLLIMLGQLDHLIGYESEGERVLAQFWDWLVHLPQSDPQTLVIGLVALVLIQGLHHTRLKRVATLLAIIVTTLLVLLLDLESVALVRDISPISAGLPLPTLPDFTRAPELLTAALAMAVLASVQSAAITESIPEPDGTLADVNRDLLGQGTANITSSLFQGMPAGGSLSRTAVNISAGARTRWSNVLSGAFIAAILLALGPFIEQITLAALAGHLIVAAAGLISLKRIRMVWRVSISARASMLITFLGTLLLPLEYSIYLGVILSLVLYVYTSSTQLTVKQLVMTDEHRFRQQQLPTTLPDNQPVIISVTGHLFFAAVKHLEKLLPKPDGTQRPVVILRLRDNQYLGSTGIQFLRRYSEQLRDRGGKLILTGVGENIQAQLERTGFIHELGEDSVFYSSDVIFSSTENALAYAKVWLQKEQ